MSYKIPLAAPVLDENGFVSRVWLNYLQSLVLGSGSVDSVSGTANRILVTGTSDVVIDIDPAYSGQNSITTLGTITTGEWQGTVIDTDYTEAKIKTVSGTAGRILITGTLTDPIVNLDPAYVAGATQGGTGQSSYTLGDTLYASGTTALSKLPGNTTTTRKFLSQTGTGSVSAAPAWAAIANGDIPDALTGKTYNGLTLTAQTVGFTISGGTTSKTLTVAGDANVSGTNTGDQTITLTGDVTGSGTGSFTATIGNNVVTLAKQAQITTASFMGRNTAGTGNQEVLSIATAKTMLNLSGTNTGDQTITLTGDVTGSGTGSFAATIANSAVTLAKMANVATAVFLGRSSLGTGIVEALTVSGARTLLGLGTADSPTLTGLTLSGLTASLPVFTNAGKQLVSNAMTGTGSVMMSASPTTTGMMTGDSSAWSGALSVVGNITATGRINVNGATDSSGYQINVYQGNIAATRNSGSGGHYYSFGVGTPGGANNEFIDMVHDGSNSAIIQVDKNGSGSYRNLLLKVGGNTVVALDASSGDIGLARTGGKVRVGDTSTPTHTMDVAGDAGISGALYHDGSNFIYSSTDYFLKASTNAKAMHIRGGNGGSSTDGATIDLEGYDYGGAGLGGVIVLSPASGKDLRFLGSRTVNYGAEILGTNARVSYTLSASSFTVANKSRVIFTGGSGNTTVTLTGGVDGQEIWLINTTLYDIYVTGAPQLIGSAYACKLINEGGGWYNAL